MRIDKKLNISFSSRNMYQQTDYHISICAMAATKWLRYTTGYHGINWTIKPNVFHISPRGDVPMVFRCYEKYAINTDCILEMIIQCASAIPYNYQ